MSLNHYETPNVLWMILIGPLLLVSVPLKILGLVLGALGVAVSAIAESVKGFLPTPTGQVWQYRKEIWEAFAGPRSERLSTEEIWENIKDDPELAPHICNVWVLDIEGDFG